MLSFTVRFRDMASDDSFYKASTNIHQPLSEENSEVHWPEVISNKELWNWARAYCYHKKEKALEMDWSCTKERSEKHSAPCDGLEYAWNTETWQAQNYMAQKHTEGPEGDQHDLVQSQKSGSRLTEMESNCGRPTSPKGQRGLDDDDDHAVTLSFSAV